MVDENGKVVFNEQEQAELDRIIGDRVSRVKKEEPEDYQTLKEITKELELYGYTGSPQEIRQAVKAQREAYQQQQELEQLQQQAVDNGITPALAKEIKELKDELKQSKKALDDILGEKQAKLNAEKEAQANQEKWDAQVKEFEEEFPDTDLNELGKNQEFLDFIEGSNWSLKTAYKKFSKLHGEIESKVISKVASKQLRSTSGSKGEGSTSGSGANLTAEQKSIVDNWNQKNPKMTMSYKEYADKL